MTTPSLNKYKFSFLSILLVFVIATATLGSLYGQKAVKNGVFNIYESNTTFNKQNQKLFSLEFNQVQEDLDKGLTSFLNDSYQIKFKKKKGIYTADKIILADVSANPVTLQFELIENKSSTKLLFIAFNQEGKNMLLLDNNASNKLHQILDNFATNFSTSQLTDQLQKEFKVQDDLSEDLSKMEKEKAGYEKTIQKMNIETSDVANDIEKNKEKIRQAEENIKKLEAEINGFKIKADEETAKLKYLQENMTLKKKAIEVHNQKINGLKQQLNGLTTKSTDIN